MQQWYFAALNEPSVAKKNIAKSNMEELYADKYENILQYGREAQAEDGFDKTHGFYIAIICRSSDFI